MADLEFPKDMYTDVRVENACETTIQYQNGELKQNQKRVTSGAMIRIFDGSRWYYSAITELSGLQEAVGALARMAKPNPSILEHPVVRRMEVNRAEKLVFKDRSCGNIPRADKQKLLESYIPAVSGFRELSLWDLIYSDEYLSKHFISSLGADVAFDRQTVRLVASYVVNIPDQAPFQGFYFTSGDTPVDVEGAQEKMAGRIKQDIDYAQNAVPVAPGVYTCVLSPMAAGIFAHESFGHKSESDFMLGDETMLREWELGKTVGRPILNIVDSGLEPGNGYTPYDDEGTAARKNYLIKTGRLVGRLHSSVTAADLSEAPTGNARALNFEYEPIVRMTTTTIEKGAMTKDELISGVKLGVYIDQISYGTGMSTFTMAPTTAYMIRDGHIAEPVKVSVISGSVMKTLGEIDGVSSDTEPPMPGSCGKYEQSGLPVGMGGPYVRVNGITVQ